MVFSSFNQYNFLGPVQTQFYVFQIFVLIEEVNIMDSLIQNVITGIKKSHT